VKKISRADSAKNFIDYLVRKNAVTSEQAAMLYGIHQQRLMFGMMACRTGFVTVEQLHEVLMERDAASEKLMIGQLMMRRGLLTHDQVDEILSKQQKEKEQDVPAELLLDVGMLPYEVISRELENFRRDLEEKK
jgi:hypothetical protein